MNSYYLIEIPTDPPSQIAAFKELVGLCDGLLLAAVGLGLILGLYRQNQKLVDNLVDDFEDNKKVK